MQKLIAEYLFQNKKCSLPCVGTLEVNILPAKSILGENKIAAPITSIVLITETSNTESFENFVAEHNAISIVTANELIEKFCDEINSLTTNSKKEIIGVGYFTKDEEDNIQFVSENIPAYFSPIVKAEFVFHPDAIHTILVGDKQTDSGTMTEYYAEEESVKNSKWWLWAAILFAIAIIIVVIYLNDYNRNSTFGMAYKYDAITATPAFKKLP